MENLKKDKILHDFQSQLDCMDEDDFLQLYFKYTTSGISHKEADAFYSGYLFKFLVCGFDLEELDIYEQMNEIFHNQYFKLINKFKYEVHKEIEEMSQEDVRNLLDYYENDYEHFEYLLMSFPSFNNYIKYEDDSISNIVEMLNEKLN